jgi:UDP-glucuronate 4-epimerase
MQVLVTGCAGFIGSHVTEALLESGAAVHGVDSLSTNYDPETKRRNLDGAREWDSFTFAELDLATARVEPLLAECDAVVHLAAEPGVRPSWGSRFDVYVANNVVATQRVLEAAKEHPERRIVFASSSSVYGHAETFPTPESARPRPFSPYGVTKLAAEHLCSLYGENYGVETVSLRLFSVYGPRQRPDMAFHRFCRAALEGTQVTVYGDGLQTRDFTFVADVVAAVRAALASPVAPGSVYNVGGGSQVALVDAIDLIAELAGRPIEIEKVPAAAGDVRATGADVTRARGDLGYSPAASLEEGLAAQLAWTEGARPAPATGAFT